MPTYRVEVTYDMGMSVGGEMHQFTAQNDEAAKKYIKKKEGKCLAYNKRDLRFNRETLSRVLE